jgi:protein phosphatase 2C family protein 2/3
MRTELYANGLVFDIILSFSGNLALSRALGDFVFKKNNKKKAEEQIVTAFPDVTTCDIADDLEFLVLACDGIWDVLSNQEVVDFVRVRVASRQDPEYVSIGSE